MSDGGVDGYPEVPMVALDTVWFQVAGTICNLRCTHCFISCAPDNHSQRMLTLAEVKERLAEAERLGVKEYYFTGGEPFMNREIFPILAATLALGPATVLTNGLLLDDGRVARLRELAAASRFSLDLRISLDGYDARTHDAIRGAGTFDRATRAAARLAAAGLNPVVTVTEVTSDIGAPAARRAFLDRLRGLGLPRPRLKVLSMFRIGREVKRARGYSTSETLRGATLTAADADALQCSSSRMVTGKGVYVCPILIDHDEAIMGETLADTLRPFPLTYPACYTCHAFGVTCRT